MLRQEERRRRGDEVKFVHTGGVTSSACTYARGHPGGDSLPWLMVVKFDLLFFFVLITCAAARVQENGGRDAEVFEW